MDGRHQSKSPKIILTEDLAKKSTRQILTVDSNAILRMFANKYLVC